MVPGRWKGPAISVMIVLLFLAATHVVFSYLLDSYSLELLIVSMIVTIGTLPIVVRLFGDSWLRACGASYFDARWFQKSKDTMWHRLLLRQITLAFGGWLLCVVLRYPLLCFVFLNSALIFSI